MIHTSQTLQRHYRHTTYLHKTKRHCDGKTGEGFNHLQKTQTEQIIYIPMSVTAAHHVGPDVFLSLFFLFWPRRADVYHQLLNGKILVWHITGVWLKVMNILKNPKEGAQTSNSALVSTWCDSLSASRWSLHLLNVLHLHVAERYSLSLSSFLVAHTCRNLPFHLHEKAVNQNVTNGSWGLWLLDSTY